MINQNLRLSEEIVEEINFFEIMFVAKGKGHTEGYIRAIEDTTSNSARAVACCATFTSSAYGIPIAFVKYCGALLALRHFPHETLRRAV